jgi:hypothetical protein
MLGALLGLRQVALDTIYLPRVALLAATVAVGGLIYVGVLFVVARDAIAMAWGAARGALRRDQPEEPDQREETLAASPSPALGDGE